MSSLTIRPVRANETQIVIEIMRQAVRNNCARFYGEHTIKKWTSPANEKFKFFVPEHAFCVADGDNIISIAGWNDNRDKDSLSDAARISAVFTHPDFGKIGIGRQLIQFVEDDIKKANYQHIILFATMNAVRFYRQAGFEDRDDKLLEVAKGHFITIRRMVKEVLPNELELQLEIA